MMNNRNEFYRVARKSLAGLTELHDALAITRVNVADLSDLIAEAWTRCQAFDTARGTKTQSYLDLRTLRTDAAKFMEAARDSLKPALGGAWSTAWAQIGFVNQSLLLPRTDADRYRVLSGLKAYYAANPGHEVAAFSLTQVRATELLAAFDELTSGVTNGKVDQRQKRDARTVAEDALEKKLRALWTELELALEPTDVRWLKFIDRIPGDPRVPEAVAQVTASVQPGGIIQLDWDDATRAARYKVLKQVVGVDLVPVVVATVEDSDATVTLPGVTPGATVKLQVVATNAVGDAPASDVVQLQAA